MSRCRLELASEPNPQAAEWIVGRLLAFNRSSGLMRDSQTLQIFLRDDAGQLVGGLLGSTSDDSLFIHILWISEAIRNSGYGKKLLVAAEKEGVRRGCTFAHLDTYHSQARKFYERHGYRVFGRLKGYASGHKRYFMSKSLVSRRKD